jgi:hypothetical protein
MHRLESDRYSEAVLWSERQNELIGGYLEHLAAKNEGCKQADKYNK